MRAALKQKGRNFLLKLGNYSQPEVIIVGAQKGGTTALFNMLADHPNMVSSIGKELHYFDNDEVYNANDHMAYHKGFPLKSKTKGKLVFECTPSYLYHHKCAERIAAYRADMKIIIVLREPAARALSAWNMYHGFKDNPTHKAFYDPRSFEEAIAEEMKVIDQTDWYSNPIAYVKRGVYLPQIKRYTEHLSREQVLIMESREQRNDFKAATTKICDFIGADPSPLQAQTANKGKPYDASEHTASLEKLRTFYQPHNEALFDFLGYRYDW